MPIKIDMHIKIMQVVATVIYVSVLLILSSCSLLGSKKPSNLPTPLIEFSQNLKVYPLWIQSVGGDASIFSFSPVVSGNSVYVAVANGTVTCLNTINGKIAWQINAGMRLTGGVGSDGTMVAVAGEKGIVLAFNAQQGKKLWQTQASSEILSAPAVGQGLVIVRSQDNRITAYDAVTGERYWAVLRPLPPLTLRSTPGSIIAPQATFLSLPGGRLSALNLTNGGPRWEIAIGNSSGITELERISDASGIPLMIGHRVCAVAYRGQIGCFDASNGIANWLKPFSSVVGVGSDEKNLYAVDEYGIVTALTLDNGTVVWKNKQLKNRSLTTPVLVDNTVVVGDFEGYIHFLSSADGTLKARIRADNSPILPNPAVAGSNVIFQTKSGILIAITIEANAPRPPVSG